MSKCSEDDNIVPENPFNNSVPNDTTSTFVALERNSIADLQKRIFSMRCALPGCHVGNFEPDFRTIQSTYSTLVYHSLVKNNAAENFKFRVIPFDTAQSLLYERITNCCFVNTNDRMPQDNIGVPLPDQDIADIADWIMKGARDVLGNLPTLPNEKPKVLFFVAAKSDFSIFYSLNDSNRIDGINTNPFLMPNNTDVTIAVSLSDDSTSIKDLKLNQLKLSLAMDDFSNAIVFNCTFLSVPNQGDFWICTFNTASLPNNQVLFMRYFVHDGNPQNLTEFPTNDQFIFFKTISAFKILP